MDQTISSQHWLEICRSRSEILGVLRSRKYRSKTPSDWATQDFDTGALDAQ